MNGNHHRVLVSSLIIALGVGAALQPVQAGVVFGTNGASTYIPAANFQGIRSDTCELNYEFQAYYSAAFCTIGGVYYAALDLPEGARITSFNTYYRDDSTSDMGLSLRRFHVPNSNSASSALGSEVLATFTSASQSTLYRVDNTSVNATYDTWNQDGNSEHSSYIMRLSMPADGNVQFRGVWLFWSRQVAPAPASATFNDVPTSHPFFNQVEQLTKSGITAGCGGGNYCPNAAVTRGQMAVFLSKALGLHWDFGTNAAP